MSIDSAYVKAQLLAAAEKADNASDLIRGAEDASLSEVGSALNQARQALDRVSQTAFRVINETREAKVMSQSVLVGSSNNEVAEAIVMLDSVDLNQQDMVQKMQFLKSELDKFISEILAVANEDKGEDMMRLHSSASHLRGYSNAIP